MAALTLPQLSGPSNIKQKAFWNERVSDEPNRSRWMMGEVPQLQLLGKIDVDHWAKLRRKHLDFIEQQSRTRGQQISVTLPDGLPRPASGIQLFNYKTRQKMNELDQACITLYTKGIPVDRRTPTRPQAPPRSSRINRSGYYYNHARSGFKYWIDKPNPLLHSVPLSAKYTFGSKFTVLGLGNAPRN